MVELASLGKQNAFWDNHGGRNIKKKIIKKGNNII